MSNTALEVKNLEKFYENGVHALSSVSFTVKQGEFLAVIGLSGSGKSTMLRCINGLVPASSGEVYFQNQNIIGLKAKELRSARKSIAMVFQHFNLISRRSVLINVLSGALAKTALWKGIFSKFSKEDIDKAMGSLELVGLKDKAYVRADELSGGQQQRVAIARALMQNPEILLADEPVASLDPATSHLVMDHLAYINKTLNKTVICNLHFLSLVRKYATRVIALKAGKLVFEGSPLDIDEAWFKKIYGEQAKEVGIE
ncbi:MAG: phosphonate ABC transporter ATP-binding protein [Bdellovibrionaceae bacterium]|nr:phosphonate ABC transporter ATP-binding protein [Pseudobdellovibrionaceae bacterium]